MTTDPDSEMNELAAPPCGEWTSNNLAVPGKLGVGVQCGWTPNYPTAYIHGTLYVKDRTDVGQLNFVVNTGPAAFPQLAGNKTAASQLDLSGSLRIVGPPVGTPVDGVARLLVDGQSDASGTDVVPLQLWRSSKGESLGIIDAAGRIGVGTNEPKAPLDVAGNTHIGGGLSIGGELYSNSLTIWGTFTDQISGTFSGQGNIDKIEGDAREFRVGDLFQIVANGKRIPTTKSSYTFVVKAIAVDLKSFTVVDSPDENFKAASVYVDRPPLAINNANGASLLSINRYGDVRIGGTLYVTGETTFGGVLNGVGIVRETQIANGAVTLAKLAGGAVGTGQIIDGAVTLAKLSGNSVGTGQIVDGAVTLAKLSGNSVGTVQLVDGSITLAKLAGGSVGSGQLVDSSVTSSKLSANAVGTSQIADGAITVAKLAGNSVGTNQIADRAVTAAKLVTLAQSGTGYYSYETSGWNLNTGTGVRTFKAKINFPKAFATTPLLIVALNGIDVGGTDSTNRLKTRTEGISTTGFDVIFETWAASVVHGAGISWTAFLPT